MTDPTGFDGNPPTTSESATEAVLPPVDDDALPDDFDPTKGPENEGRSAG